MELVQFVLQEWQIVLIGFAATLVVQALRYLANKRGLKFNKVAIQWFVFLVSVGLGAWFGGAPFPPLPVLGGDPTEVIASLVAFVGALGAYIGQILGAAFVVYHVLAKKIFDSFEPLRI